MSTVRDVFIKRGVAISDKNTMELDTTSWSVDVPLTATGRAVVAQLSSAVATPLRLVAADKTEPLRCSSVGYLFSAAVKDGRAVNVVDTRLQQWSAASLSWRLPMLRDSDSPMAATDTLTTLAASVSRYVFSLFVRRQRHVCVCVYLFAWLLWVHCDEVLDGSPCPLPLHEPLVEELGGFRSVMHALHFYHCRDILM